MKKLVVFDMAGTTINDRDEVYRVLRETTERAGASYTTEQFQQLMGTEKKYAIGKLFEIGGVEPSDENIDTAWAWFREELKSTYEANPPVPLPGVEDALNAIHQAGAKIALTTGFSREIAEIILSGLAWSENGQIDVLAAGDEVPVGRPEPYLIQLAMERSGISDKDAVISVGDTEADVVSAQRAGVMSVGVMSGHLNRQDFVDLGADVILESAAEFTNTDLLS
ncbi:HAD hydrolase-like protein [Corynebacterium sp. p3-SID1145]|uniref:HAD hydrolase-like protein n=1 Tax=unclassified Corynebacterium TaxID=2624378 RepID=UPI0021AAE13E|nr:MULTISPECIES: HAD hydrolase-like protein [unclassified Corynebacterium]MCT1452672.1 HAD hydrolase-like protein [Corynebacterium sp. p3-SID1145]MCT1461574.1 HAD hydrolase-like protein [Corynebacterium sp. p3-SID1140]